MQPKKGNESLIKCVNIRPLSDVTVNYCALIQCLNPTSCLQSSFGVVVDSDNIKDDFEALMKPQIQGFDKLLYCERLPYGNQVIFVMLSNGNVIKDVMLIANDMNFSNVIDEIEGRHGSCIIVGIGKIWVEGISLD